MNKALSLPESEEVLPPEVLPVRSVLLVHERFPPDFAGGGEYFVLMVAKLLQSRGIRVKVITAGDPAISEYEGIVTQRLPVSSYRFNLAWKEVAAAAAEVDLIHSFTYHAMIPAHRAARALGKPLVCGVLALFDEQWLEMKGALAGRAFRWLERRLLRLPADAKIYISDFSQSLACQMKVNSDHDYVIEPGISIEEYWAEPNKDYVLFAGKIDVRKGIDVVVEAARKLPDIPFKVLGWGDAVANPGFAAPENLELIKFESRVQLSQLMAGARVFLFPSKAETFGLVIAEAMASGCAVVSTLPLPFSGKQIPPDDSAAAAAAVAELWQDTALWQRASQENLEKASAYNWEKHMDKMLRVYQEVMVRASVDKQGNPA